MLETSSQLMVATSLFVHVRGRDFAVGSSQASQAEADAFLRVLLKYGSGWFDDGLSMRILVAYSGQAKLIQAALRLTEKHNRDQEWDNMVARFFNLPTTTVDSAQGSEADIVLASLVRANSRRDPGFLADAKRTNVLLNRARVAQITFGHAPTLSGSNWNDFPAMLRAFDETGGLFSLEDDERWLPADPGAVLGDTERPEAALRIRLLADVVCDLSSGHSQAFFKADARNAIVVQERRAQLCPQLDGCATKLELDME